MSGSQSIGTSADSWIGAAGSGVLRVLRRHAAADGGRVALRYLDRGEREADSASYVSLDRDARVIAARLRAAGAAGRPVLVALPQGLDYVRCFLGCLYAGAIAVPTPGWDDPRAAERVAAIVGQADPALVIAEPRAGADALLVAPGELLQGADDGVQIDPAPGDVAFLQYTSGSTSRPKGVAITHGNIAANLEMIRLAFGQDAADTTVSWLPLHHDMGLIGGVLEPLYLGASAVLMSPLAFLQRPARWLHAISEYDASTCGAPNFGYEFCARMVGEAQIQGLDLSGWKLAFCGAEPVRAGTLERFAARFGACGFDPRAFYPCYGMAEATLFVTGGRTGEGATVVRDLAGLAGAASVSGATVSCGFPRLGCEVALLEPGADRAVAAGAVGEIVVAGPQVSPGFWQADVGVVADEGRLAELGGRRYLRSGDLGRMVDGNLHVVGRLRNMVILRGANIHAEDVEQTVAQLPGASGLGAIAVLPVTEADEEGFVLVCELARGAGPEAVVLPGLAAAVAAAHGILPRETLLVAAGGIRRTLSGKLQREATRAAWREGSLEVLARHVPVRGRGAA